MDNSELKRRLKAEQKAKEKEAKQSQKVLHVFENLSWFSHVVKCLFYFNKWKAFDFLGTKRSSFREQKEG